MAPLSDPMTIRLPDELVAWLEGKVEGGVYKDKSVGIRRLLEAAHRAEAEQRRATEIEGEIPRIPWFKIPLRRVIDPFGGENHVYTEDAMFAPEAYIPFGLWSDDKSRGDFTVETANVGGSADLLGLRPTPLGLASENCWRTGFPSRLLFDPNVTSHGTLAVCKYPNTTSVSLSRVMTPPPARLNDTSISEGLKRRLMVMSPAETPPCDPVTGSPGLSEAMRYSMKGSAVELLTVRELLMGIGFDLQELGPRKESPPEPLRLALLAVAPEYQERLYKRLTISMRDFQVPAYAIP
jgi:Arc/MetJ-type ribon-helix-helix transcriptional regulator